MTFFYTFIADTEYFEIMTIHFLKNNLVAISFSIYNVRKSPPPIPLWAEKKGKLFIEECIDQYRPSKASIENLLSPAQPALFNKYMYKLN